MADPLSVAASITGLMMAGVQITTTVGQFISNTMNAPDLARTVGSEVHDFVVVLSSLQSIVLGSMTDISRTSMIDVDQLVVTLTACVCTFSDLEKEIEGLTLNDNLNIRCRMKWAWAESTITGLVERLQHHKASLNLMLTILTCAATAEATSSMQSLRVLVEQMSQHLTQISLNLSNGQNPSHASTLPPLGQIGTVHSSASSIRTVTGPSNGHGTTVVQSSASSILTVRDSRASFVQNSAASIRTMSSFNFESTLLNSRLYARAYSRPWRDSTQTGGWSVLSGRSLAEVSNISVLELPMHAGTVSNPWWYDGSISEQDFLASLPVELSSDHHLPAHPAYWPQLTTIPEDIHNANRSAKHLKSLNLMPWTSALHLLNHDDTQPEVDWSTPLDRASAVFPSLRSCINLDKPIRSINDDALELDGVSVSELRDPRPPNIDEICWSPPVVLESDFIQAILNGDVFTVQRLLDEGYSCESRSYYHYTALACAAKAGHAEVAKIILRCGADIEARAETPFTPLQWAAFYGHETVVETLLEHGADDSTCCTRGNDNKTSMPIVLAAIRGHREAVIVLMHHGEGPDPSKRCTTCNSTILDSVLSSASIRGIADVLLEYGGPRTLRIALLQAAISKRYLDLAGRILQNCTPADLSGAPGRSVLDVAVETDDPLLFGPVCEAGTQLFEMDGGNTLLHVAARNGSKKMVENLLKRGSNCNAEDSEGLTPLQLAIMNKRDSVAALLWDAAPPIHLKDTEYSGRLHKAVADQMPRLLRKLLDVGTFIDETDAHGCTALHVAARSGTPQIIMLLLSYGAERDAKDNEGNTPLVYAVRERRFEVAQLLCAPVMSAVGALESTNLGGELTE